MKVPQEILQKLMGEALAVAAQQDAARLRAKKAKLQEKPAEKTEEPKAEG